MSGTSRDRRVARILEVEDARQAGDAARLIQLLRYDVLDESTRQAAIQGLGRLHAKESAELLCEYLGDQDEKTRVAAAVALRTAGTSVAVDRLVAALEDVDRVAWCAADALGKIGSVRAVSSLARVLESHDHWWVRRSAAGALASIGGDQSIEALRRAVQNQKNPLRRRALSKLMREAEASARRSRERFESPPPQS